MANCTKQQRPQSFKFHSCPSIVSVKSKSTISCCIRASPASFTSSCRRGRAALPSLRLVYSSRRTGRRGRAARRSNRNVIVSGAHHRPAPCALRSNENVLATVCTCSYQSQNSKKSTRPLFSLSMRRNTVYHSSADAATLPDPNSVFACPG